MRSTIKDLNPEEVDNFYQELISTKFENKGFRYNYTIEYFKVFGQDKRYSAYLYYLSRETGKFKLEELLDYTPESIVLFNKNESVLFLKEIWGEDETYWDCHQYIVKEFIFENGYFSENEKGTTKAKHCLIGSQNLKEDLKNINSYEKINSIGISCLKFYK